MELVIFSALEGLQAELDGYRELAVVGSSRLDHILRLLRDQQLPDALYLDDSRGVPAADLWRAVAQAQQAGVRVLLNLFGPAQGSLSDALGAGIAALSERNPTLVAAWLAEQLGVQRGAAAASTPIIAVSAAKGGIGKTFASCVLAEGLRRRGLNVLVWDSDISNPGLVPAFRIPSSAPSYLHLVQRGPAHWNPRGIAPFIFQPEHTHASGAGWGRIDFLIGSHTVAKAENDVRLPEWQGFYKGVAEMPGYDLVLIDTPPDYLRRPYATHVLQSGGSVILPAPPGARERMGVGHLLDHFREHASERLEHCALLFMQPERGVTVSVRDVAALFARRYPQVGTVGTLPRAPRLASQADEHDGYISMLDLAPLSPFAAAVHQVCDALCARAGLTPPLPQPRATLWSRLQASLSPERADSVAPSSATLAAGRR